MKKSALKKNKQTKNTWARTPRTTSRQLRGFAFVAAKIFCTFINSVLRRFNASLCEQQQQQQYDTQKRSFFASKYFEIVSKPKGITLSCESVLCMHSFCTYTRIHSSSQRIYVCILIRWATCRVYGIILNSCNSTPTHTASKYDLRGQGPL